MKPAKENLTDEILWTHIQRGDIESFEIVYGRFFKLLYSYGRKISSDAVVVEDAIHDLFLDVWNYREKLFPTTSVRFYLFRALRRRIVKNEAKDARASTFTNLFEEIIFQKTLSAEDLMIEVELSDERIKMLKRHLPNLPPRQYEALILKFYDDFTYTEIAALLEVNEQSARNLVQRGLEHLRNYSKIIISFFAAIAACDLF